MSRCPSCSSDAPEGAHFCPDCGAPFDAVSAPTGEAVQAQHSSLKTRTALPRRPGSSDPSQDARFLPGSMLAKRYRIVSLLGRGGMGEVYRADDLKLGQPVALKFLPPELDHQAERLDRFLNEVRLALKVSHPNVCRVYDVGEIDGHHFISMEFVDGENLAGLLRRIGHFPQARAAKVAWQICAGLAAAHDQGILHRDLKPANIMIDGRGNAKITDFGLARAGELEGSPDVRAGTPAYMAPEQRAGKEVTARSDIYALGLVLYELFTGKAAYREPPATASGPEHARPSNIMEEMGPGVERIILQCLEEDPSRRPPSALAVSVVLPGGDPLAAAQAAGETPTPGMVAEARATAISPRLALLCLAGIVILGAAVVFLSSKMHLASLAAPSRPPAFLQERAREILAELGYTASPYDSLFTFQYEREYVRYLGTSGSSPGRWEPLRQPRPTGMKFGYRQGPVQLTPYNYGRNFGIAADYLGDPPPVVPGMVSVTLDGEGHLQSLRSVPEPGQPAGNGSPPWDTLMVLAGLEDAGLVPDSPDFLPPVHSDERRAWRGTYPEDREVPILVQAAALAGRVVFFRIVEPWSLDSPVDEAGPASGAVKASPASSDWRARLGDFVFVLTFLTVLVGLAVLAVRNLKGDRADPRSALNVALFMGVLRALWMVGIGAPGEKAVGVIVTHVSYSLYAVAMLAGFYLAVEPYFRRLWPRSLTSWVRLARGRFTDAVVGRDVLLGVLAGTASVLVQYLERWLPDKLGLLGNYPFAHPLAIETLRGTRQALMAIMISVSNGIQEMVYPVVLLLILRLVLRRTDLAVVAVTVIFCFGVYPDDSPNAVMHILRFAITASIFWVCLFRFGILAAAVNLCTFRILFNLPLTPDLSSGPLATSTLLTLAICGGLSLWGFRTALGGQKILRDPVLGPDAAR